MIISCDNCNKKFNINSDLIPDKGRLLQCGKCDHKWFFKIKIINNDQELPKSNNETIIKENLDEKNTIKKTDLRNNIESSYKKKDILLNENFNKQTNKDKISFLNITMLFIISFIALIILIDTFKTPISIFIPNIEFILYNLYETIKDINLFFRDLI